MDTESTVIGIDLGGTKIAAARYSSQTWEVQEERKATTEASRGFTHVLEELLAIIEGLQADSTQAIGIGVPGLVRHPDGVVLKLPNIPGAENIPLEKMLTESFDMPCTVDNDANCFTLAEATGGAGKGCPVVLGITLGTGVGGGIVIDGKIFRGSRGYAAEFGHMLLRPGLPPYETADKRGDVEQFLSGTAMGKRCRQARNPADYLSGDTCSSMHPEVVREVAWMCASLTHIFDPSVIVFGGSAGLALSGHLPAVCTELAQWVLPGTPLPPLKISELADAATRGAAQLTRA